MSACSYLPFARKAISSSWLLSKWSSMARLLRPITKVNVSMPAAIVSSAA